MSMNSVPEIEIESKRDVAGAAHPLLAVPLDGVQQGQPGNIACQYKNKTPHVAAQSLTMPFVHKSEAPFVNKNVTPQLQEEALISRNLFVESLEESRIVKKQDEKKEGGREEEGEGEKKLKYPKLGYIEHCSVGDWSVFFYRKWQDGDGGKGSLGPGGDAEDYRVHVNRFK